MRRPVRYLAAFIALLISLFPAGSIHAEVIKLTEDFDVWTPSPFTSQTNQGWIAINTGVGAAESILPGSTSGNGDQVLIPSSSGTRYIQTPTLTNGFQIIRFETAGRFGNRSRDFDVDISTNSGSSWTTITNFTHGAEGQFVWVAREFDLTVYEDAIVRLVPQTGTELVGFNNFEITEAPAKVDIGTPTTDPDPVFSGDDVDIEVDLFPSPLATITAAKVIYTAPSGSGTNNLLLQAGNTYRTQAPIPAQSSGGIPVNYTIEVTFTGSDALSPASTSTFYNVQSLPLVSNYETLVVTGDVDTVMTLVGDNQWYGVIDNPAPLSSVSIQFYGEHTNGVSTTTWGDASPTSTNLIIRGTATDAAPAIVTGPLPAGQIAFRFNATTGNYEINNTHFQDFESWTGATTPGNYSLNDWHILGGWITNGISPKIRGSRALILPAGNDNSIRSPELTDGIGTLNFWLRHDNDSATPIASADIQVSAIGTTNATDWLTIQSIPIVSGDASLVELVYNSRQYRYVRIRNTGANGDIIIDDVAFAAAGSGVLVSNLTHTPNFPSVFDSVPVTIDITPERNPTITAVQTRWQANNSGSWTSINMANTTGNTWQTLTDIPAVTNGGYVDYYVEVAFTGYQASAGSPVTMPLLGAADPASYNILPAYIAYTNEIIAPPDPEVSTDFAYTITITPEAGASDPVSSFFYRHGTSGAFTEVLLSTDGSNIFETVANIPVPAHPGTPVQYYVQTFFTGPFAASPAYYPEAGPFGPGVVLARATDKLSAYTNVYVNGDFSGALTLTADRTWRGIISLASPQSNPSFNIIGTSTNPAVTWGDNSATAASLPLYSTAVASEGAITLSGTHSNTFHLVFNEQTGLYQLHQAHRQDFESFTPSDSFTPGSPVTQDGWSILNATVFNTNANYSGNTLRLGGSAAAGTNSLVESPAFNGVGNISFFYRNLDQRGSKPGHLAIELSSASQPTWRTLTTVTNILTAGYLHQPIPFQSPEAGVKVRIVWQSSQNPTASQIAIDNLVIEAFGPGLNITNIVNVPSAPVITNTVGVNADLISLSGATNITGTVWYRAGTNATFDSIPMTSTGGSGFESDPYIPRTQPGLVQYYIEAQYESPHGDGPYFAYGPQTGPLNPLSYTNVDELAAFTQFTPTYGWVANPAWDGGQTNSENWVINDAMIRALSFATSPAQAAWLTHGSSSTNSHITTPLIPTGQGALQLSARVRFDGNHELQILQSTDGVNWNVFTTLTNLTASWTDYTIPLNIDTPGYLRFYQSFSATLGQTIGIEDISISYPLADVTITNTVTIPYFPAASENTAIRTTITSKNAYSPASGIEADLYYRLSGTTNFTGPIPMSADGDQFTSLSTIPAQPAGSTIEYYIESRFNGYSRFATNSPRYAPENHLTAPFAYTVRPHASAYQDITAAYGTNEVDMAQTSDGNWQGLLQFLTNSPNATFTLKGYDYYDGSSFTSGFATEWGDDNQQWTNIPLSGTATPGGTPIVIPEIARGQYVLRFDEATGQYSLQRAAFQNFNTWPADNVYFAESWDTEVINEENETFSDWPESTYFNRTADFELGWSNVTVFPATNFYSNLDGSGAAGFYRIEAQGAVVTQSLGQALMFAAPVNNGEIWHTPPQLDVGTISFEARATSPFETTPALYGTTYNTNMMIQTLITAQDLPITENNDNAGNSYKSLFFYQDTNNYYEARIVMDGANQRRAEIWEMSGGVMTPLKRGNPIDRPSGSIGENDTFTFLMYQRTSPSRRNQFAVYIGDGTTAQAPKDFAVADDTVSPMNGPFQVGIGGMDAKIIADDFGVYEIPSANFNVDNPLYETDFNNATGWNLGSIWNVANGFLSREGYIGDDLTISVDYTTNSGISWTPIETHQITNSAFNTFQTVVHNANNILLRLKHTSGNGHVMIDNIDTADWEGKTFTPADGWVATNAWVTTGQTGNGLELRKSRAKTGQNQYLQSPVLTNGAGVLSFNYKSVTGTTNQLIFAVEYTRTNAPNSWLNFQTITNNPVSWTTYSTSFERELQPAIYRLRIRNVSTDIAAGILLDNVQIIEPVQVNDYTWWAYNTLVSDLQTDKLAPLEANIKGAYLNDDQDTDTNGQNLDEFMPFIQSAKLPQGIGEVSFYHRAWDAGSPANIQVVAATNRLQPEDQWILLDTVTSASTNFAQYTGYFYDTTNRYIKLRISTNAPSPARAAIDDVLITAPFAANLRVTNLELFPEIPLFTDDVRVRMQLTDFFANPSVSNVWLYYKQGTNNWGNFSGASRIRMNLIGASGNTQTYQSFVPIAAPMTADTIFQFQIEANFGGFFSHINSPAKVENFVTPDHYWPIDLNDGQAVSTPYYIALSCLPGQVWINEFNVVDGFGGPSPLKQYIELVGVANANIGNWHVEVINTDFSTNSVNVLSPGNRTIPGTNGFGFIVIGDSNTPERDELLTNALPLRGGIQLVRNSGIIDQQVAYDSGNIGAGSLILAASTNHQFVYAGVDDDFFGGNPMAYTGTGSNTTDFAWTSDVNDFGNIGNTNLSQVLIPWPTIVPDSGYDGPVEIMNTWLDGARIYFTVETESDALFMTPWYSTNLMVDAWTEGANQGVTQSNTTYTVWCDHVTTAPGVFYTITADDGF